MKLTITQLPGLKESEVDVRYSTPEPQLQKALEILRDDKITITVRQENSTRRLSTDNIMYFESVDEKTFVYDSTEVYSCDLKLYEVETLLCERSFVRISKSCILNIDFLDSVKVMINGRMEAKLQNGEKLIINRHYVPAFKRKFE